MIDNKYWECLNNLFDKLYCNIYDTKEGSTLSWNYKEFEKFEYNFFKNGKKVKRIEYVKNPIETNYSLLIIDILYKLRDEIESNVNSLIGKDKKEYINSIIENWEKRIEHVNAVIKEYEYNVARGQNPIPLRDSDKLLPLQVKYLTEEIGILKIKYVKYFEKDYKNELWFKTGVLIANGEMDKLLKRFNGNTTQIAKYLENPSYRPYISESISAKPTQKNKCIFLNKDKMLKIINHCEEFGHEITKEFINRLPLE